jgi:hypothetical protein
MAPESADTKQSAALEKRELASDVLAAQGRAQVQARYLVARQNPRDWDQVRQRLLRDCDRPFFADAALYSKPMGNSKVTGLSIRFAEAAQRAMGNIMPERLMIYDDATKRIVRMAITDLEANVTHFKDIVLEKTVERKDKKGRAVLSQRMNSYGDVVYLVEATEDELLTKEAAITSKIERMLTLKILPADIQEEAIDAVRNTQRKRDKEDPQAAKNKLIDAFDELGVRVPDLKAFLGADSLDNLQPKDLEQLRAVYTAIKEGETNWREVMEQRNAARGTKAPEAGAQPTTGNKAKAAAARAAANREAAKPRTQTEFQEPSAADPTTSASSDPNSAQTNDSSAPAPSSANTAEASATAATEDW